jgi:hypothetical protein
MVRGRLSDSSTSDNRKYAETLGTLDRAVGSSRSGPSYYLQLKIFLFSSAQMISGTKLKLMKNYAKILFSILAAAICTVGFAADKPNCKATGKNCPMNNGKECNCGKSCDCAKM